ncbi:VIT1/CCC1 transporter family protein [Vannielia litorea]|uniref:Predicted Fe2+/Mn2+ transporter, VIT1/CCC1 family n=1 Tax=Vannielia litorea TaxID=1217970 RepID=A0A1N6FAZ4_9RHOB|nr:VIT1/CCC1 transporter family protein [Vannielia litorea]SIN92455.1 Predicted Fe2+/Mn2+ transporter, VIT1/CCC1 family [Vannielia litorea]
MPLAHHLKQITYGGNDGIVTTFAIVAGFAGAEAEGAGAIGAVAVLVFGLANLFADGVSMGLGEFLSTRSARALYRAERARVLEGADRRRLVAMLGARGLTPGTAARVAEGLEESPELVADLLAGAGVSMPDLRDATPARDGVVTFGAFLAFGLVPLLPFLLAGPEAGSTLSSVAASLAALTALGLLRARATGERGVRALGEVLGVGVLCGLVAYGVGALVG